MNTKSSSNFNIQNQYLNKLRKGKIKIFLQIRGDRTFEGHITAFDNYSILIKEKENSNPVLIFKHSISYISPVQKSGEIQNIGEEF